MPAIQSSPTAAVTFSSVAVLVWLGGMAIEPESARSDPTDNESVVLRPSDTQPNELVISSGSNHDLRRLAKLKSLRSLYIVIEWDKAVSTGLESLQALKQLESLKLYAENMPLEELKVLEDLSALRELDLTTMPLGDSGLRHLRNLTSLRRLRIAYTGAGDKGMQYLKGMRHLEELDVYRTLVGDEGLEHLSSLTNLKRLWLFDNPVSDAGLKHISRLKQLEDLALSGTMITDQGLKHLAGLKNLKTLYLQCDRVTRDGARALRQALPGCNVRWTEISLADTWSVAFSPDGQRLAFANADAAVRVRKLRDQGDEIYRHYPLNPAPVVSVAFLPDGERLFSGDAAGTVWLWNLKDRSASALMSHDGWAKAIAVSSDGKIIVSAGRDGQVKVWDMTVQRIVQNLAAGQRPVWAVAVSADGNRIASGADSSGPHARGRLAAWNATTGERLWEQATERILSVAFSPDGKSIASGEDDGRIRLWDAQSGELRAQVLGHSDRVWSVAFSPSRNILASASTDMTVKLWDAGTLDRISDVKDYPGRKLSLAFSPDGNRLAVGHSRGVGVWKVSSLLDPR